MFKQSYLSFDPTRSLLLHQSNIHSYFSFFVSSLHSALHSNLPGMSTVWLHLLCVVGFIPSHSPYYLFTSTSSRFDPLCGGGGISNPIGKWRIRCRCSVSFSAQLSASLMSAWPLWSCPLMFWGTYHVTSNSLSKYAPFYLNSSAIKAVPARPLILLLLVFSLSVISLLSVSAGLSSQG